MMSMSLLIWWSSLFQPRTLSLLRCCKKHIGLKTQFSDRVFLALAFSSKIQSSFFFPPMPDLLVPFLLTT